MPFFSSASQTMNHSGNEIHCLESNAVVCPPHILQRICSPSMVTLSADSVPVHGSVEDSWISWTENCEIKTNPPVTDRGSFACCTHMNAIATLGTSSNPSLDPSMVSASSFLENRNEHGFGFGGMHRLRLDNEESTWCAEESDLVPFVHFTLPTTSSFTSLTISDGLARSGVRGYPKAIKVEYRKSSAHSWMWITDVSGKPSIWRVLEDHRTSRAVSLGYFEASEVRIHIVEFDGPFCCMRLDLFGYASLETFNLDPIVGKDPEDDKIFFELNNDISPSPFDMNIDTGNFVLRKEWLNYEKEQNYELSVKARDEEMLYTSCLVNFVVENFNDPPEILSTTFTIEENAPINSFVGQILTRDQDFQDILRFTLMGPSNGFRLERHTGKIFVKENVLLDFETVSFLEIVVSAVDYGSPPKSTSQSILIYLEDVNENPMLQSDQTCTVQEDASRGDVVCQVVVTEPDTTAPWNTLSFLTNSYIFSIDSDTGEVSVNLPELVNFESDPDHLVHVSVRDGGYLSSETDIFIQITDINEAPTFSGDVVMSLKENVVAGALSAPAVVAMDEDRPMQALEYSLVPGSSLFAIDALTGQISSLYALDYEDQIQYELQVRALESNTVEGLDATTSLTITVQDVNEPPVVEARREYTLRENLVPNTIVGDPVSEFASDPENDVLQYTLVQSAFSGWFSVSGCSGQLRNMIPLDFEQAGGPGYHGVPFELSIKVSDGIMSTSDAYMTIELTLTDVNEAPAFVASDISVDVAENTQEDFEVIRLTAFDPDSANTLTYGIVGGNNPGIFTMVSENNVGFLKIQQSVLDYEGGKKQHILLITVSDGTLLDEGTITVNVKDVNEAPICLNYVIAVDENSIIGTPVGMTLPIMDKDASDALSTPDVTFDAGNEKGIFRFEGARAFVNTAGVLDHESTDIYHFTIKSCDEQNACSTCSLQININDVNEAPELSDDEFEVAEHSSGVIFTVQGTDIDADHENKLKYSIVEQSIPGMLTVESLTGAVSVVQPSLLDYEVSPEVWVKIKVTDIGSTPLFDIADINLSLVDINDPPVAAVDSYNIIVREDHSIVTGENSILSIHVTDQDPTDVLTFTIVSGNDPLYYSMSTEIPGDVLLITGLNYEVRKTFALVITSCDASSRCVKISVTINVQDVNEAPLFILPGSSLMFYFQVSEKATIGTSLGTLDFEDIDEIDAFSFEMAATSPLPTGKTSGMDKFNIDKGLGSLVVLDNTDFEQNGISFAFDAIVTDKGKLSDIVTVIITVEQENHPPVCATGLVFTIPESALNTDLVGTPLKEQVTDEDADTVFSFTLFHGTFSIGKHTGQLTVRNAENLDFENPSIQSFLLPVTVTDDGNAHDFQGTLSSTCLIKVVIEDVNEEPTALNIRALVAESIFHETTVPRVQYHITAAENDFEVKRTGDVEEMNANSKTLFLTYDGLSRVSVSVGLKYTNIMVAKDTTITDSFINFQVCCIKLLFCLLANALCYSYLEVRLVPWIFKFTYRILSLETNRLNL